MPALPVVDPALNAAAFDQLSGALGRSYLQLERRLDTLQQELARQRPLAALGEMSAGLGPRLTGSLENLAGALANLCLNALEAGARQVTVERQPAPPGRLRLAISDDGPGMAPALRGRVFEPFVSGRPGGTGLGLAVARGVIERHHGTLRLVDSGLGCRFEIALPCQVTRRQNTREPLEA